MNEFISAIITAAGSGNRMGADIPKLELKINGSRIIDITLSKFIKLNYINEIILVTSNDLLEEYKYRYENNRVNVILGGKTREESTFNAIKSLDPKSEIVICHDGARPIIDENIINNSVNSAKKYGSGIAAVKAKDTIKCANSGVVINTLDRDKLFQIQTPQTFKVDLIRRAYDKFPDFKVTDDASLVEHLGEKVYLIEGSYKNIKITTPEDLIIARAFLEEEENYANRNRI